MESFENNGQIKIRNACFKKSNFISLMVLSFVILNVGGVLTWIAKEEKAQQM